MTLEPLIFLLEFAEFFLEAMIFFESFLMMLRCVYGLLVEGSSTGNLVGHLPSQVGFCWREHKIIVHGFGETCRIKDNSITL